MENERENAASVVERETTRVSRKEALYRGAALTIAAVGTPLLSTRGALAASASREANTVLADSSSMTEWGFGTDNTLAKARVDAFVKAYPSIKLNIVPQVNDQKILTAVASGDVPDLLWLDRTTIVSWAARGALQSLDDLIAKNKFQLNQFYPSTVAQVRYNGHVWAVPQFMDVRPLWVNLQPLQEVGLTLKDVQNANWHTLQQYGVKMTKRQGSKVSRWGFDTKAQDGFFWMYSWGNGSDLLSADGKHANFDDPKNVEALKYVVDTVNAQGGFAAFKAFSGTWGWNAQHPFIMNQTAMTPYENWLLGMIAQFAPSHSFAVLPFKGQNGKPVSLTGGSAWAIPTGAKNQGAAWTFINFMSQLNTWKIGGTADKQQNAAKGAPFIPYLTASQPVDRALVADLYKPISAKFDQVVKLFPYLLQHGRSLPASPVLAQIIDILNNQVVSPALLGTKSPAAALKDGQSMAQQAIDQFHA
jgi:multiple sugar transport system substrate-binding protein